MVLEAGTSKDKANVRIVGHAIDDAGAGVQPVPGAVSGAGGRGVRPDVPARGRGPGRREEIEVAEEDINTAFYRDGEIDLGELIHEQFYLTLPMKPLCREDCKGLCPVCGANWNQTTCACERRWEDPRLAG